MRDLSLPLRVFNLNNFTLVGTLNVPGDVGFSVGSLVRWGNDGMAFRTENNQVFLLRIPASWIGPPPATRRPGQITSQ